MDFVGCVNARANIIRVRPKCLIQKNFWEHSNSEIKGFATTRYLPIRLGHGKQWRGGIDKAYLHPQSCAMLSKVGRLFYVGRQGVILLLTLLLLFYLLLPFGLNYFHGHLSRGFDDDMTSNIRTSFEKSHVRPSASYDIPCSLEFPIELFVFQVLPVIGLFFSKQ